MLEIDAKTIINKAKNGDQWFGFDYNMNLYQGCPHGCIYCDSRSDCYHVENFDTVRKKKNALFLLEKELSKKKNTGVIGVGAMSDSYNPFEQSMYQTRGALELIEKYRFGVSLTTKSDLIVRDIDILKRINKTSPVIVGITITTSDDLLAAKTEPHVARPSSRFRAVNALSKEGIFTGVLLTPTLPFITDTEENIKSIVKQASSNNAKFVYAMFGVTLRSNQRDYFYQKLLANFPGLKEIYEKNFHESYMCNSPNSLRLWQLFKKECEKYHLLYRMKDIINAYKHPKKQDQLSLFENK